MRNIIAMTPVAGHRPPWADAHATARWTAQHARGLKQISEHNLQPRGRFDAQAAVPVEMAETLSSRSTWPRPQQPCQLPALVEAAQVRELAALPDAQGRRGFLMPVRPDAPAAPCARRGPSTPGQELAPGAPAEAAVTSTHPPGARGHARRRRSACRKSRSPRLPHPGSPAVPAPPILSAARPIRVTPFPDRGRASPCRKGRPWSSFRPFCGQRQATPGRWRPRVPSFDVEGWQRRAAGGRLQAPLGS